MDRPGINVIGHVAANLGVGVVTRQVIELVETLRYPVAAFNVDHGTLRPSHDRRFDRIVCTTADALPYRINLFVLGLGALDWTLKKCPARFFDGSYVNAAVCFWELPLVPAPRLAQLDAFDVVIGSSDYLRHVFQNALKRATTIGATLPITLPSRVPFDRISIGIPHNATAFVFSFDPASDPERKNPFAAIRAFIAGAANDARAFLVIRVNNACDTAGAVLPIIVELEEVIAGHPRIVVMTKPMSYPEVLGLYEACDVYLSLHRAEGLGLGMAEAMTLGKAVIATGWSGNTSFMKQSNACMIDYAMVPVRASLEAYREDRMLARAHWAEPNIEHAAACISYLSRDHEARRALGRAAAADMAALNAVAARGAFIDEVVAFQRQREVLRNLGYERFSTSKRPELHLPAMPISRRAVNFADRVRRKLAKSAAFRSLPPSERKTR